MTIKEKVSVIDEYCNNNRGKCDNCKIEKLCESASGDFESDINKLEQAYTIIANKNNVNHPKHYNSGKFECIDIMRSLFGDEAVKGFCKCNIFKYTYRANLKNGDEDRKKADWYTEYLMKMDKGE